MARRKAQMPNKPAEESAALPSGLEKESADNGSK
jgi:hypothetical protein